MSNALKRALLGKLETTPGTAVTLAAGSDAIRLISSKITTMTDPLANKAVKQTFGNLPHHIINKGLQLDVEFYLRRGAALGSLPDFLPIFHAANHNVISTAGVKVDITPFTGVGVARHTSTFAYYEDGLKWDLVGAMATCKIDAAVNDWLKVSATIFAPFAAAMAAALPAGLAFQSSPPLVAEDTTVITDANAAVKVGSFSFDTSAEVEVRNLLGGSEARMTGRDKPLITFSKTSLSTTADFTRITSMVDGAFSAVFGSAGDRVTIAAPRARYEKVEVVADGVNMNRDISLALYETAGGGDDAYSLTLD